MGYHRTEMPKGEIGELSKVHEEMCELTDAIEQDCKLLILIEMSDLLGAIELYTKKHHNLTLKDLIQMKDLTAKAFIDGDRV